MTVNQDTEFTTDIMTGTGGILYAPANKTTKTDDEGKVSYEAELIKIDSVDDAEKAIKNYALDNLEVTTENGNTFDANEVSILSLSVAIKVIETNSIKTMLWKLADNEIKEIPLAELEEALYLATEARSLIIVGS